MILRPDLTLLNINMSKNPLPHDFFAKKFVLSMIICIFAALVPAEPLYNA